MPDFERVFDDLSLNLAPNDLSKSKAEGFIAGKKYARKEILFIAIFLMSVAAFIFVNAQ